MRTPRPTHCIECGKPLVATDYPGPAPAGTARYGGHGLCGTDYARHRLKGTQRPRPVKPKLVTQHHASDIPTNDTRGTYLLTTPEVSPQTARAASLVVCRHAHDTDDARDLLTVLGLRWEVTA
jgi:hypothetical protein